MSLFVFNHNAFMEMVGDDENAMTKKMRLHLLLVLFVLFTAYSKVWIAQMGS